MKLEVLLSVMNLDTKDLDKMNITSKCTVIDQCGKNNYQKYKNFDIYSYDEIGSANSRNRGLEHVTEDIILLCDDDVVYNKNYEKMVLEEFKNHKNADMIIFNVTNIYRNKKINRKFKRLHLYNSLSYAAYNVAFKKNSRGNIKMNTMFGPGAFYKSGGDDTLFIVDFLKNNLKIYSSNKNIGKIANDESTWFKGYNDKYFFDKGALFTAINKNIRHILMLQYLIRHKNVLTNYSLKEAYKIMLNGSKDYIEKSNKWKN